MDIAAALDALGLTSGDLAYRGLYQSRHFMDSWLSLVPEEAGTIRLQSLTCLDSRVLGGPSPPQTAIVEIVLASNGQPLRASQRMGEKKLEVDFVAGEARLADGSHQPMALGDAGYVLDNNHPGLVALLLMLLSPRDGVMSDVGVFLISALTAVPYRLSQRDDGALESEFGEVLHLDVDGVLAQIEAAGGAVVLERLAVAPPRPVIPDDAGGGGRAAHQYQPPEALKSRMREIEIEVPQRGMLAASFTQGAMSGATGLLVLQGSGEVDRHGFSGGIDTGTSAFADALALSGFAVLRFDKRGVGQSRRMDNSLPGEGFRGSLADAEAALSALRTLIGPDAPAIILGHSLGGLAALALSAEGHEGHIPLVLLAVPGRPLPALIEAQTIHQGQRMGLSEETIARQLDELDHFFAYARGEVRAEDVRASALAGRLAVAAMADLSRLDPTALIRQQRAPVLLLQGGRDIQVDEVADFGSLRKAAEHDGVPIEARVLPELNHLFRKAASGEGLETYAQPANVDPEAVRAVVSWCEKHYGPTSA